MVSFYEPLALNDLDTAPANTAPIQAANTAFTLRTTQQILAPRVLRYLVDGLITVQSLVGVYGSTGHGKSFAVVDLACCIASGKRWHGRDVKQGTVLYLAAEDTSGIERRVSAWVQSNPRDSLGESFLLSDSPCLLPDQTAELIQFIKTINNLRLIVLDTVNMTFSGNENDTTDMTAYMKAAKELCASYPDLSVLLVHHSGKAGQDYARGSVAFKANLDAEFCVKMDAMGDTVELANTKAKNAPKAHSKFFKFSSVTLDNWTTEKGEHLESAVLYEVESSGNHAPRLAPKQKQAYDVLLALCKAAQDDDSVILNSQAQNAIPIETWATECALKGVVKYASYAKRDMLKTLEQRKAVMVRGDCIAPAI